MQAQRQLDAERLARAQAGDPDALTELYAGQVDGLWAFVLYRVGRDEAICEDVVQETFLVALEGEGTAYDPARGSLHSWLCSLSRNVIRRHRRAMQRSEQWNSTWERIDATLVQIFSNLEQAPLGDEVLARAETRDLVHMTIANLPDDYRSALERKYVDGDSLRELAVDFSLSEAATKSLLTRARRAFRDAFVALTHAFAEPGDQAGDQASQAGRAQEIQDVRA